MYIRRLKDKDNQTSYDAVWIAPEVCHDCLYTHAASKTSACMSSALCHIAVPHPDNKWLHQHTHVSLRPHFASAACPVFIILALCAWCFSLQKCFDHASLIRSEADRSFVDGQTILAEGFLISGRMLKDHLVSAVEEGLVGALQRLQPEGDNESSSESEEASDESDSAPTGMVRLCLTGHPQQAMRRARKVHRKHTRQAKDRVEASRTGQVAHLSSSVDH